MLIVYLDSRAFTDSPLLGTGMVLLTANGCMSSAVNVCNEVWELWLIFEIPINI